VQTRGQLTSAAAYKSIIVAYRDNNPVRLQDVAEVLDGVETDKSVAWINDTRGVILAIRRQP
jgi:HAE1 family hydrophobic/amphiphilic exporter-1